ncbi:MAG: hypothetical protein QOE70_5719 [Chthoniobacter sp.]|jgi:hypothetical protein|nr:hypothetical protein [Chthoniobacter sp.]
MPPQFLAKLDEIGKSLIRWQAELKLMLGLAVIAGWVCLLGFIDLWLRLDRPDRLVTWTVLLALVGGTLWLVRGALRLRFTPEAVAASVEKTFPQLDNHLINYLQLARNPEGDPFKAAYLRAGVPEWQNLDFRKMRDEKAHRRSQIMLSVAAAVLLLPALFFGQAWAVAVWRTVNPFSTVEPPSLTKILQVQPGQSTVLQGEPLVLSCTVKGFEGHEVRVEIEPGDAQKSLYSIGRIHGGAPQEFSYRLTKVTTGLRYRFRAGDAPNSAWFTIGTRPPPAFTAISLVIVPPAYTKLPPRTVNARDGRLIVPTGSEVRITATSKTPFASIRLRGVGRESIQFASAGQPTIWKATATLSSGTSLTLKGEDTFGSTVEEEVPFALDPDKAPGIEVVSPNGRAILPPGARPQIEFQVADDFGVSEVVLEEVAPNATREDKGTEVKRWKVGGAREFHQVWKSENSPLRGSDTAYRIVARDNRPEPPNESFSGNVVFNAATPGDMAKQRNELEQAALANLQKVLDLQKRNLADTGRFHDALKDISEAQWNGTAERQKEIRSLMHDLLANPIKPLGSLTAAAQKLYVNEMMLAIDALQSIPAAEDARKATLSTEAVALESKILKQLSFAMAAAGEAKIDRRVSGLSALIEALVRDQGSALTQTHTFVASKAKVGRTLVDAQDRLGGDVAAFLAACKDEAAQVAQTDAALAETINKMVARANELKIRSDMVVAAERLDQNQPAEAVPLEERAVASLKSIQAMLDQIKLKEEAEKRDLLVDAVKQAQEKLAKLEALNQKMKEAMEQVKGQKNKDDKAMDEMEEEFQALQKNIKEALLEVPNDLHIFTELNVANDLVEDVFSVFQEIEQKAGSEKDAPDKVTELGYAKEDELLAQMGEASKRLDAMEMWLGEKPDELKITTEAHDKAEMPESGIALAELAAAAQDLVGDLMKEEKKMADKADDSATNHAMPDFPAGNEVMEGDIASFGAQGKSGNQTPDHKEQDGRSNVGRQGMSTGETAAGSGTIGEGDKNIEARRTEDPVQSGKIDLAGKADTKATGGGKLGTGKADAMGMGGGAERMDSKEAGSAEGMAALMARQADALYAKASMKNVRVDSLKDAAHQLRQSGDAIARGDIQQVREFRKMAVSSLTRAATNLAAGPSGAMEAKGSTGALDNVIESGPDQAPPKYRDKVAEYYKALNGAL